MIADRDLDGADVSPRALFVVAGNRVGDNAGANEIPTHLRNRFAWFEIETDVNSWCAWAEKNDVLPIVIDFIKFRPALINQFDPKSKSNAYATPRSITRLSRVLKTAPRLHWMTLAAAICGPTWAAEFEQFRRLHEELPAIDDVLANPQGFKMPKDFGVIMAMSSAVVRHVAKDHSKVDAALQVIERVYETGKSEIVSAALRDLYQVCPAVALNPKAATLFQRVGHLLS